MAEAAGGDPGVLRLENLDTDLPPPREAIDATREAIGRDEDNSYLPFIGRPELREAIAERHRSATGRPCDPADVVVTCGGTEGMLDAVLALTEPGDEVILTDPTYAGMIYRVRLAGALPRLVPLRPEGRAWRLDLDALRAAVTPRCRLIFLMNPSIPSGAVLEPDEWEAVAELCRDRDLRLLYNAAMERILFDDRTVLHPAALPGMAERTITVGSVSKEFRMIGWRIGWVVAPPAISVEVARVHIYNTVTATGISQAGALAALRAPDESFRHCRAEWERRRDALSAALEGYGALPAAGGWSQLLDVASLGHDSFTASRLLLERGRVAATPMRDWGGPAADRYVRLVFSNEPVERLAELGPRLAAAFGPRP